MALCGLGKYVSVPTSLDCGRGYVCKKSEACASMSIENGNFARMTTTYFPSSIALNSAKAWLKAARPVTLTAALVPVLTASALAFHDGKFRLLPALLCVLFASLMQVASNFINDLFDFLKGTDGAERLGPLRACAQGWITPRAMRIGIGAVLASAALVGLLLVFSAVWSAPDGKTATLWLLVLGAACMAFAFLYTTFLSYHGGGDVLVYLCFGFVPVYGTYYVQTLTLAPTLFWLAAAVGLVIDTLLIVNNYRDRDTDRLAGKHTLIARFGARFGSLFYLFHGVLAYGSVAVLACYGLKWALVLPLFYVGLHVLTWQRMTQIYEGKQLNRILALTSRNMLLFGILVLLALVL